MQEKLAILQMLQDGTVSVEEANKLLEAVQDPDPSLSVAEEEVSSLPDQAGAPGPLPNMGRLRRLCYVPLAVFLVLAALSGWGTVATFNRTEGRVTLGFVLLVVVLVLSFVGIALALWATAVPWLHVRIHSAQSRGSRGTNLAISLPLPLSLAGWGLRAAHRFLDQDTAQHLDAAAALVTAMRQSLGKPGAEPIMVDIDDEDERVQVYIG